MIHIDRAFKKLKDRNWENLYVAVDLHGTVIVPNYKSSKNFIYYPNAVETLRYLSNTDIIKLIIYSSSYNSYIDSILEDFLDKKISIDYINSNPEVESNSLSDFSLKFYFDILLDDKAGFNPETDWIKVYESFKQHLQ